MPKSSFPLLPVILIGLVIVLATGMVHLPFAVLGQSNFLVKSISSMQVISPDTDLKGAWFLVDATLGGGQTVVGTVTPTDFKSWTGYETTYPIMLEMDNLAEEESYPILNEAYPIYRIKEVSTSCGALQVPSCPTTSDGAPLVMGARTSSGCSILYQRNICWYKQQVATKGHLGGSTTSFGADLKMTVSGETITKRISSSDTSVAFIKSNGDLVATATWSGSAVTGNKPPNSANYVTYARTGTTEWVVGTDTAFGDYQAKQAVIDDYIRRVGISTGASLESLSGKTASELSQIVNTHNNYVDSLYQTSIPIQNQDGISIPYTIAGTGTSKYLKADLNYQITVPEIVFKVRADWIGVKITVGKPVLTNAQCPAFNSGEEGSFKATLTNQGGDGTFTSTLEGCSPFRMKYSAPQQFVKAGQSADINIPIDVGTVSADVSQSCKLVVYDVNKPTSRAEISATCQAMVAKQCVPGSFEIISNCLYKCKDDGMTKEKIKCCGADSALVYNTNTTDYDCVGGGCGNGSCDVGETIENCPQDCKKEDDMWKWIILGAIVLIAIGLLTGGRGPATPTIIIGGR